MGLLSDQHDGRPLVGTVLSSPDPALAECAAHALDLVWIDLEHAALGLGDMQSLVMAVQGAGCEAHVRVPRTGSELLPVVLDVGADGIVAPSVETAAAAREFVGRLRYPPHGSRGFGPRRAGRYGRTSAFWSSSEARVSCTVQIESSRAVENVEEIAATDGIDALVVGTADLSLELGLPQQLNSDALRSAVTRVAEAAAQAGVDFGLAGGGDPEQLCALAPGARLVVHSVDLRLYAAAVDAAAAGVRKALSQHSSQARIG